MRCVVGKFNIILLLNLILSSVVFAATSSQTFTIDGQLFLTGTTTPLLDGTAKIKVYIMNPAGTCLLYAEEQTVDTLTSNGYFNIQVGSDTGAGKRVSPDPGRTMLQVYQNSAAIAAANVPGQTCAGNSYTPVNGDGRLVRVIVTPTAGSEDPLTPDMSLDLAPMSKVAETIQGIAPAALLQVNNSGAVALSQINLEAMFTGTAYTNLQAVMAGTFGAGAASSVNATNGTAAAPSMSFSNDTDTGFYYAGSNQIGISSSGVNIFTIGASGMVSATTGGAALSTAVGTAAAPTLSFAGDLDTGWWRPAADTMAASTGGGERMRIDPSGKVGIGTTAPVSILDVASAGATSAMSLHSSTTGYTVTDGVEVSTGVGGVGYLWNYENAALRFGTNNADRMLIGATGNIGIGTTSPNAKLEVAGDLRLNGATSGYVGFQAPATVTSVTYTLPTADGSANQVLRTSGTGVLSWVSVGSASSLIADSGSVTAPSIAFSGDLNTGMWSPGADIVAISASGVERLRVDASGITAKDTVLISGSTSGYVGLKAAAAAGSTIYTLPVADGSANAVLTTNGTGVLSWVASTGSGFPVALGTAAAPSMNFSGDTNTGIYSPGADVVAVSTSGVERLRVNESGYVGIGTTSPGSTFHVVSPYANVTANTGQIRVSDTSTAWYASIGFDDASDTTLVFDLSYGGALGTMSFRNGNTPMLTLDPSSAVFTGKVQSNGYLYSDLSGATSILFNSSGANWGTIQNDTTGTWSMGYKPNSNTSLGTSVITWTSSGNAGIGTTNPQSKLEVAGGDIRINGSTSGYVGFRAPAVAGSGILTLPATVGTSGQVMVTDGSGVLSWAAASGGGGGGFPVALGTAAAPSMNFSGDLNTGMWSPGADMVAISTSGVERLRVNESGYVGIGTTSLNGLFTIHENSGSDNNIYLSNASGMSLWIGGNASENWFWNGANAPTTFYTNNVERMRIGSTGNIGIGTPSPGANLDVKDTIHISGSTSGYVGLKAPAAAGSTVYTLPSADGSANAVLATDGSGVLSWAAAGGGGSSFPIALGTAAAPSMNFSGDTNTGIYSPGADLVAVSTSGVERLRVNSSGYIGIGTTNPTAHLTIDYDDGSFAQPGLIVKTYGGGSNGITVEPGAGGNGYVSTGISITASATGLSASGTGGSSVGVNASGGAIGVSGSTFGGIGVKGDGGGGGGTGGYFLGDSGVGLRVNSVTGRIAEFQSNGSLVALINNSGNVGIGTTSPDEKLVVSNGNFKIAGSNYILINTNGAISYRNSYAPNNNNDTVLFDTGSTEYLTLATTGAAPINFFTNSAERMRIDVSGNIGIGTTNPSALLTVDNGTTIGTYTTGGWNHTSDERLKKDIKTIDNALGKVVQLRGVEYKFKKDKENRNQLGFIAQETEKVFPETVTTDSQGMKSMNYANLVAPVVEAIKDMHKKIMDLFKKSDEQIRDVATLQEKAKALEKENSSLKTKIEKVEKFNSALKAYLCSKDPTAALCKR